MEDHRHCDQCGRVKSPGLEPCCGPPVGEQVLAAIGRENQRRCREGVCAHPKQGERCEISRVFFPGEGEQDG